MENIKEYFVSYKAFDSVTRTLEGTKQIKVPIEETYNLDDLFGCLSSSINKELKKKYPDYPGGYVIKIQNVIPVENILSYKKEEENETKYDDFSIRDLLLIYKKLNDLRECTNNIEETVSIEERMYRNGIICGIDKCIKEINNYLEKRTK